MLVKLWRGFMKKLVAGIVAGCAIAFGGQALAQETLTVWWVKGLLQVRGRRPLGGDQS
jgi:hypothetical protein